MNTIIIIPARKGSKGIPGKNKKELAGKPLIQYTIEVALQIFPPEKIYLSTDDPDIIKIGVQNGLNQTNLRPSALSTDTTSARELLLYEISKLDMEVETIVYLQPTSPLRQTHHVIEAMDLYDSKETEMVVSVSSTKSNPYYNLFEENKEGFLSLSKKSNTTSRQDVPDVFKYNGAIYIINYEKLKSSELNEFKRIKKYVMTRESSIDIDDYLDWIMAETLIINS